MIDNKDNKNNKNPFNNTPFNEDFGDLPGHGIIPEAERGDATRILIDYNEKFKNERPILFRDEVLNQTLGCLIGAFKPNPLLVGPAGVGKTKIVEDIARRIANQDLSIPEQLRGCTIYELPLGSLVSGSRFVGDIEEKIMKILEFAADPDEEVILFIDEIHLLMGKDHTYQKVAELLKPELARGNLKIIGATTLQESRTLLNDPAFSRRFTKLIVDELSPEQTVEILADMRMKMFRHYKEMINIPDCVLEKIVTIADEEMKGYSHRPDNAITLFDRSMAAVSMRITAVKKIVSENPEPALQALLDDCPVFGLSKRDVKRTAEKIMGGNNKCDKPDLDHLKELLHEIKGQDDIAEEIMDLFRRDSLNIYPHTGPITLLFAGNSGVGKTETAKIIAEVMTHGAMITLNMAEYYNDSSINKIIGSPMGYVGSDSKQEMPFDILESNPYQVILLDEFEKSCRSVQRLFLSAFDEGYIRTAKGQVINFRKSIIIATTNAGHTDHSAPIGFVTDDTNHVSVNDLANHFDPELLNRFTKILNFHPVTKESFKEVLCARYENDVAGIKKEHSSCGFLPDHLDDEAVKGLADKYFEERFGARPAKRAVKKYIEDLVYEHREATRLPDAPVPE